MRGVRVYLADNESVNESDLLVMGRGQQVLKVLRTPSIECLGSVLLGVPAPLRVKIQSMIPTMLVKVRVSQSMPQVLLASNIEENSTVSQSNHANAVLRR